LTVDSWFSKKIISFYLPIYLILNEHGAYLPAFVNLGALESFETMAAWKVEASNALGVDWTECLVLTPFMFGVLSGLAN
jgi:hypothetical protein